MIADKSAGSQDQSSYDGFDALDCGFAIADQVAMEHEQTAGSLDHPNAGQHIKSVGGAGTSHNLDFRRRTQPSDQQGEDASYVGFIETSQEPKHTSKEKSRAFPFECARNRIFTTRDHPEGIEEPAAIATHDVINFVETGNSTASVEIDTLAGQNVAIVLRGLPLLRSDETSDPAIDRLRHHFPNTAAEDVAERLSTRNIPWKYGSRVTSFRNIKQRDRNPGKIDAGAPTTLGPRKRWFDHCPLRVSQVRRVMCDLSYSKEVLLIELHLFVRHGILIFYSLICQKHHIGLTLSITARSLKRQLLNGYFL